MEEVVITLYRHVSAGGLNSRSYYGKGNDGKEWIYELFVNGYAHAQGSYGGQHGRLIHVGQSSNVYFNKGNPLLNPDSNFPSEIYLSLTKDQMGNTKHTLSFQIPNNNVGGSRASKWCTTGNKVHVRQRSKKTGKLTIVQKTTYKNAAKPGELRIARTVDGKRVFVKFTEV
jgi:hypothetical protein